MQNHWKPAIPSVQAKAIYASLSRGRAVCGCSSVQSESRMAGDWCRV